MNGEFRKLCLLLTGILLGVTSLSAQIPNILWTKTYGGTNADHSYSVQQTSDGGYIIGGSTMSFGAGIYDVYLIKTDANGDTLWTKTYGGTNTDEGFWVQQTSDGGYIVVGYTWSSGAGKYDVYLIKTDANGDTLWTKTYGGVDADRGNSIQQTSDEGYIIAGYTLSFGAGLADIYLIKTDADGDTLWTKTYGGAEDDYGYSVQQTSDGGYIVAGYTWSFATAGRYDVYVIKTDANGDTLWTKTYGGSDADIGSSVQQTSDGGYIITGRTYVSFDRKYDVYLIKLDANGDTLWTKTYGGTNIDYGYSIQQTSDGGYIVVGCTLSSGAGLFDVYLIKTDVDGDTLWTKTYGGTKDDYGYSVQQTSDDGYIIAGETRSFGAVKWDIYFIKLVPELGIEAKRYFQKITSISQNKPNPFMRRTSIEYGLSQRSYVHIVIYDLVGQKVRTLVNGRENAGTHTKVWDGADGFGNKLQSGIYFARIQVGDYTQTKKMILIE